MIRNEKGQVVVEYILITSVLVILGLTIIKTVKDRGILKQFADGPTEVLRGMIESGVWKKSKVAAKDHPGFIRRKVASKVE